MDEDLQLPNFRTVRMELVDVGDGDGKQRVKLCVSPLGVTFYADGHSINSVRDRPGVVVCTRLFNGQLEVAIWGDINQDDPTHVVFLANARLPDI